MSVADTIARIGRELEPASTAKPWAMLASPPADWDLEAMYETHRGAPVSATPHVMIAVPLYGESAILRAKTDPSRRAAAEALADAGIECTIVETPGDSLVQRMRQRVAHTFLKSRCTHLLWWDADIECLTPALVVDMVRAHKHVIAGAVPFKNDTRSVVCNLFPEDLERGRLAIRGGCLRVLDAGTGIMLVHRSALIALMQAHPELLHWSRSSADYGEPLWAVYDTAVRDGVYLSEDYAFCRLWQDLGGDVFVFVPAKFRHWGLYGYAGSLEEQYGFVPEGPAP